MTTSQKDKSNQAKEAAQRQRRVRPVGRDLVVQTPQPDWPVLQRAIVDPGQATPSDIVALQQAYGNRAVTPLVQPFGGLRTQPKLTVGPIGDRYEQEADRVAAQVMTMPVPVERQRIQRQEEEEEVQAKSLAASITPLVQRQEEDEEVQMKPLLQPFDGLRVQRQEEEELQMKPLLQPFDGLRVQRQEEEELQMIPLVQRQEEPEEEIQMTPLLQPFDGLRVQRQEEELQMSPLHQPFDRLKVQRQTEEEELVQGQTTIQCQLAEEKELQMQAEEEEEVQTKASNSIRRQEEEEAIQAQLIENQPATVSEELETRIYSARGSGQPISENVREPMEHAFGADFSGVRVHTDSEADVLNKQLSAKAFTTEQDVFFRQGEYSPGSDSGRKLIAHELTHVVQQSNRGGQLQMKTLSEDEVVKVALGVVRADAPTFSHVENLKWMKANAKRRIGWELTAEKKKKSDDEDVEAVIAWVVDYVTEFRDLADLYKVVGMLADAAGEKGKSYDEQIRNVTRNPLIPEAQPPTIVFGPAPSRGFYESKTHSIQIDLFKHETALDVLDTILFESINAARTEELGKDIEGIEEYGTDVAYVAKLREIYSCGTTEELCKKLGLSAHMTKADEKTCLTQGFVPMPTRDKVGNQAARQALWHWKTEGWKEESRKQLWGASPHAPNMKASVKL